jgi:hypothetical protein
VIVTAESRKPLPIPQALAQKVSRCRICFRIYGDGLLIDGRMQIVKLPHIPPEQVVSYLRLLLDGYKIASDKFKDKKTPRSN